MEGKGCAVIALLDGKRKPYQIFKMLQHKGISKDFVYRTIKRYNDSGSVKKRYGGGRQRTARTPKMLAALKARIRRNPRRNQKKLALQMNVSRMTINRALKEDLKVRALKIKTCHYLTAANIKGRREKCAQLLARYGPAAVNRILFTDEKYFTIEAKFNRQNDRVYAKSRAELPHHVGYVTRRHHPEQVMVWAGVSAMGKTPLHFCELGVKTKAKNYQEDILEQVVKPLNDSLFNGEQWSFQQDSAPSHKAKTTQRWLTANVPDFISTDAWPSASPDLNPLDYAIWSKLEAKVCCKPHTSVDALKRSLLREWDALSMDTVRKSIEEWRPRLEACIRAKGGYFEDSLY